MDIDLIKANTQTTLSIMSRVLDQGLTLNQHFESLQTQLTGFEEKMIKKQTEVEKKLDDILEKLGEITSELPSWQRQKSLQRV